MSQWVNNYAILRDLSVAQGRGVPVRINGVVAGDERPPALHIAEETEEQFFRQYMSGGGESSATPDLSLIQQMLEMVHLNNPAPEQQMSSASMLNPNCAEFVPQSNNIDFNRYYTDRRDRNVALKSLLEADNQERLRKQNIKLLKPDDIIQNNGEQSPAYLLSMQPAEMFKKKSPTQKLTVPELIPEPNNNVCNVDMYEPSEFANEYYNKCMERNKLKTYVMDDIWTKAEKKMKEIENRRKRAAELANEWALEENNQKLNLVRLPYHRHVIAEECVVCEMVKKHSFNVDNIWPVDKRV